MESVDVYKQQLDAIVESQQWNQVPKLNQELLASKTINGFEKMCCLQDAMAAFNGAELDQAFKQALFQQSFPDFQLQSLTAQLERGHWEYVHSRDDVTGDYEIKAARYVNQQGEAVAYWKPGAERLNRDQFLHNFVKWLQSKELFPQEFNPFVAVQPHVLNLAQLKLPGDPTISEYEFCFDALPGVNATADLTQQNPGDLLVPGNIQPALAERKSEPNQIEFLLTLALCMIFEMRDVKSDAVFMDADGRVVLADAEDFFADCNLLSAPKINLPFIDLFIGDKGFVPKAEEWEILNSYVSKWIESGESIKNYLSLQSQQYCLYTGMQAENPFSSDVLTVKEFDISSVGSYVSEDEESIDLLGQIDAALEEESDDDSIVFEGDEAEEFDFSSDESSEDEEDREQLLPGGLNVTIYPMGDVTPNNYHYTDQTLLPQQVDRLVDNIVSLNTALASSGQAAPKNKIIELMKHYCENWAKQVSLLEKIKAQSKNLKELADSDMGRYNTLQGLQASLLGGVSLARRKLQEQSPYAVAGDSQISNFVSLAATEETFMQSPCDWIYSVLIESAQATAKRKAEEGEQKPAKATKSAPRTSPNSNRLIEAKSARIKRRLMDDDAQNQATPDNSPPPSPKQLKTTPSKLLAAQLECLEFAGVFGNSTQQQEQPPTAVKPFSIGKPAKI